MIITMIIQKSLPSTIIKKPLKPKKLRKEATERAVRAPMTHSKVRAHKKTIIKSTVTSVRNRQLNSLKISLLNG
jgi:hypothetical protein